MKAVIQVTDKEKTKKEKLELKNSCFLIYKDNHLQTIDNIALEEDKKGIIEIRVKNNFILLKNLDMLGGYQYAKELKDSSLLYKNFDYEFEKVGIRDQFIIDNDLYYVKAINVKNVFQLNSVG